jgi:uncharacterized protein (DUF2062 family)
MPRREELAKNRWLKPISHRVLRSELWRFTRRSVPRGVALGVVVGILIPVAQTFFAALLALPFRANVPVAALTTFLTNPLTTPPLWVAAYYLGNWMLKLDSVTPDTDMTRQAQGWLNDWLAWLLSNAAPATAVGLVTLAFLGAILFYLLSALGWRLWIARKWRRRKLRKTLRSL